MIYLALWQYITGDIAGNRANMSRSISHEIYTRALFCCYILNFQWTEVLGVISVALNMEVRFKVTDTELQQNIMKRESWAYFLACSGRDIHCISCQLWYGWWTIGLFLLQRYYFHYIWCGKYFYFTKLWNTFVNQYVFCRYILRWKGHISRNISHKICTPLCFAVV